MAEILKEKTIDEINNEIICGVKELLNANQFGYVQVNVGNGTVTIQGLKSKKYKIKK